MARPSALRGMQAEGAVGHFRADSCRGMHGPNTLSASSLPLPSLSARRRSPWGPQTRIIGRLAPPKPPTWSRKPQPRGESELALSCSPALTLPRGAPLPPPRQPKFPLGRLNPPRKPESPALGRLFLHATVSEPLASVAADPEAAKLIAEVQGILEREHPDLPLGPYGRDDQNMIWWFLRDRKFNIDETVVKLRKAIRWRYDFGVGNLRDEDVAEEASTGKAYLHTYPAIDGRPVIVVAAAKHFPNSERLVASEQLCVFLIEQALQQLPPGEEKFLGIFDLRGFTTRNADLAFVGFLVQVFFYYYPKRLHKVLFVDAPPIFQPGWRMMKPMLKSYASLVEFCSAEDVKVKYFAPGQAPSSFVG